ncbi:hypothetical protein D0C16_10495 [Cellvibrio sp. KY-GH-1]|uniref:hypothetical protein n=1 Tax=Cellvibrio sp. KY-GH-1 TaxID=2303332 RepID=UPI001244269D|nr:hypothetical protein [Cellvibrio sp. KY-GH-1]QEY16371.1 hypothetical protein D0C16_10495 [Cellvibrio sp. KY-GH-1]
MSDQLEALLQPSLNKRTPTGTLYSAGSHVIVGFFGGPLAMVLFSMWGAHKIHQLGNKLYLYLGCLALALITYGVLFWLLMHGWPEILNLRSSSGKSADLISTLFAVGLCGLMYLALKDYFRVGELVADGAPSPWVAGACAVFFGYVLNKALFIIIPGVGL